MVHSEIHQLLSTCISAPVECDGFARLAHTVLTEAGIEHNVWAGHLAAIDGSRKTPVHCWVTLADGHVIDYRARMWLGEVDDVPYGIFARTDFPGWIYCGQPIDIPTLPSYLFQLLLEPSVHMR